MINLLRVVSLSLLCLTVFATPASAECAWVVWQQTVKPVQEWAIFDAHPTVTECSAWLVEYASTLKRDGYSVSAMPDSPPRPGAVLPRTFTFRKGGETGSFMCLPDTVDPRGPKGK
jgi:hypothetical protein